LSNKDKKQRVQFAKEMIKRPDSAPTGRTVFRSIWMPWVLYTNIIQKTKPLLLRGDVGGRKERDSNKRQREVHVAQAATM